MKLPDDWVSVVKDQFSEGCPNGTILRWDVNRFFSDLKSICIYQKVKNITDFNYAYCNKYLILPGESEGTERVFEATIAFSFICNAFSFHWTSYSPDKRRGRVIQEFDLPPGLMGIRGRLTAFAKKQGFVEIQNSWMDIEIDGVELELASVATLGKCLFEDF